VVAGLPLARLADTKSRSVVLLVGVVFWSAMVLLTGFVKTFWQLLLLRIFLGIGEVSSIWVEALYCYCQGCTVGPLYKGTPKM